MPGAMHSCPCASLCINLCIPAAQPRPARHPSCRRSELSWMLTLTEPLDFVWIQEHLRLQVILAPSSLNLTTTRTSRCSKPLAHPAPACCMRSPVLFLHAHVLEADSLPSDDPRSPPRPIAPRQPRQPMGGWAIGAAIGSLGDICIPAVSSPSELLIPHLLATPFPNF